MPDPEWGSRLVAAVVPSDPAEAQVTGRPSLAEHLGDLVDQSLGRAARPRADPPRRGPAHARVREGRSQGRCWSGPTTLTGSPDDHLPAVDRRSAPTNAAGRTRPGPRRDSSGDVGRRRRLGPRAAGAHRRPCSAGRSELRQRLQRRHPRARTPSASAPSGSSDRAWPSRTAVKRAALLSFAVAGLAGLALVMLSGLWWLLLVGAAAIVAAWTYTGGPRPYGYAGLGEVFVFVFFGLVAVGGTAAVQVGFVSALAWTCGVAVGALSCAILVVNNLRDIPGDTVAGKRTLAVRIGDPATRRLYAALVGVALAIPAVIAALGFLAPSSWPAAAVLGLGAVPLAVQPLRDVRLGARGPALVAVLVATGGSCWCTASSWPRGSRSVRSRAEPTRSTRFAHRVGDPRPRMGAGQWRRVSLDSHLFRVPNDPAPGGPDAAAQPRNLRPDLPRRPESRRHEGPGGLLRGQGTGRDEGRVPRGHLVQGLPGLQRGEGPVRGGRHARQRGLPPRRGPR